MSNPCGTCNGSGRTTKTAPVIKADQLVGSKTKSVRCGSCGGSGLR